MINNAPDDKEDRHQYVGHNRTTSTQFILPTDALDKAAKFFAPNTSFTTVPKET